MVMPYHLTLVFALAWCAAVTDLAVCQNTGPPVDGPTATAFVPTTDVDDDVTEGPLEATTTDAPLSGSGTEYDDDGGDGSGGDDTSASGSGTEFDDDDVSGDNTDDISGSGSDISGSDSGDEEEEETQPTSQPPTSQPPTDDPTTEELTRGSGSSGDSGDSGDNDDVVLGTTTVESGSGDGSSGINDGAAGAIAGFIIIVLVVIAGMAYLYHKGHLKSGGDSDSEGENLLNAKPVGNTNMADPAASKGGERFEFEDNKFIDMSKAPIYSTALPDLALLDGSAEPEMLTSTRLSVSMV